MVNVVLPLPGLCIRLIKTYYTSKDQYFTTFLSDLRTFVISYSVRRAFLPSLMIVGKARSLPIYLTGKACQGQTLELIVKIRKLQTNFKK
jgi:hypothetical protein